MSRMNDYDDQVLEDEPNVNLQTLAPGLVTKSKARKKMQARDWTAGEVMIAVSIKELKFSGKKVSGPEIITLHQGEKKTVGVPFKKKLNFAFSRVEDEMIFKFAVTSHGDLLGFIYLEIPQKFRTMKEFRLDDWFPVKQVEVDEDEVIKMQNFVARIIIEYKAKKKLELKELFSGKIPREKMYKMMAKNMRNRIKTINEDVNNFHDEGFTFLAEFERKLLAKRQEFNSKAMTKRGRQRVKVSSNQAKDNRLETHKHTFYKGKPGVTKGKRKMNVTSKVAEVFHKDTGKDVLAKGGDLERQAEDLLQELTKTKRDLVEKNQRIRALNEGKKNVDNGLLGRTLEGMRRDLLRDKKELAIRLKEQTKAMELEREKLKYQHGEDLLECGEMKTEINDVKAEYLEKQRQLERLEDEMNQKKDAIQENESALHSRLQELDEEEKNMEEEKLQLEELEDELDQLKERMLLERQKIYKEGEKFSYDRGDISTKDKQLNMQEDMINEEREKLDLEREETFANIERREGELENRKKNAQSGNGNFQEMKEEMDFKIKDLMQQQKANKTEEMRLDQVEADVAEETSQYLNLKKVADEEKEENQKTLENDYDFIEQQMGEIDNKRKDLDKMQKGLEDYEAFLKEQEASTNLEIARFNQDRAKFFDKVEKSEFNKDELQKIAKSHGHDLKMSKKAALLQEKREVEMERKKNKLRSSIVGIGKNNDTSEAKERKRKMNDRRSTMVNRLSMTGQNLNALRMEHKLTNIQTVAKFIDVLFNDAVANKSSQQRDDKKEKLEELMKQLLEAQKNLTDTQTNLQQSKLKYFLNNPKKKKKKVIKKRMSLRPKDPAKRKSHAPVDPAPITETNKNTEETTEVITKTITRMDSHGNEIIETITETITTTKEEVVEEVQEGGEGETHHEHEHEVQETKEEEVEMEEFEEEYEEEVEEEEDFDPEKIPKNMLDLQNNLFKLCNTTISKLEKAKPNIEKKNKITEKVVMLDGGKNCVGNIFKVIHILNNKPESLDNAILKQMEEENNDFDFDAIRLQYEAKIIALITYIKRIRSNYNFFNQGIDHNLLIN